MPKTLRVTVVETVNYEIDVEIAEDADEDTIMSAVEAYWTEHGDPTRDFVSVEDRSYEWGEIST